MEKKYDYYYYDAMDALSNGHISLSKKLLKMALKEDQKFIDAYNGLAAVYEDEGNKKKARESSEIAYNLTKKEFKEWPEEMEWGFLENRPYLRAICNKAIYFHEDDKFEEAKKIYHLLLKLNPGDNQGVRYLLAVLYEKQPPNIVDKMMRKGNIKQNWEELENILEKQNRKHKFWKDPE